MLSDLTTLETSTTLVVRRLVFEPTPAPAEPALLCAIPSSSLCRLAAAAAIASSYSGPNPIEAEVATIAKWSAASSSSEIIIGAVGSVNERSRGRDRDSARVIEAYQRILSKWGHGDCLQTHVNFTKMES